MTSRTLGIVAAMPQEIAPLLRRMGNYGKERAIGFNLYRFSVEGVPCVLVESGMGPAHAAQATEALVQSAAPEVILNYGFGGAVLPGLEVGELVMAERVYLLEEYARLVEAPRPDQGLSSLVQENCLKAGLPLRRGSFVTATGIMNKSELASSVKAAMALPLLEMESAAVLQVAQRKGIPALALRGVSDAADEELGFSLEEFCDPELNLSGRRIFWTVVKKPHLVPQLLRLARNSKRAGQRLAQGVEVALRALARQS